MKYIFLFTDLCSRANSINKSHWSQHRITISRTKQEKISTSHNCNTTTVLTAASPDQAQLYDWQLNCAKCMDRISPSTLTLAVPHPDGQQICSDAATLNAIHALAPNSTTIHNDVTIHRHQWRFQPCKPHTYPNPLLPFPFTSIAFWKITLPCDGAVYNGVSNRHRKCFFSQRNRRWPRDLRFLI